MTWYIYLIMTYAPNANAEMLIRAFITQRFIVIVNWVVAVRA